jgi:hypothetical protein
MYAGKFLALLAGILSLVGTYVIAIYGIAGNYAGSGIGFIVNIPTLFLNAPTYAEVLSIEVWLFYFLLVVFIIFLVAGLLQIIFMKSRILSIIFSLFPLGVGLMFIFLGYTVLLGSISDFFGSFFSGEHFGSLFPFIVNVGGDLGLGAYFILGGGTLGLISGFMRREA